MQRFLNSISNYYPSIPTLTVDGNFGSGTQAAVTAFQRLFGLSADGVIGRQTWDRIFGVYNEQSNGTRGIDAYPGATLRLGSSGEAVTVIQRFLNSISNYYPSIPTLTIDGSFGSGTQAAVVAFQRLFGLSADGAVGRQTWDKIVDIYNSHSVGNAGSAFYNASATAGGANMGSGYNGIYGASAYSTREGLKDKSGDQPPLKTQELIKMMLLSRFMK
jgi:peptidoglycan hydrolase-like protein with peptidoglycan-binding domain